MPSAARVCGHSDFNGSQMPLPQRAPHLAVGISLEHTFDQPALVVQCLIAECRHGLIDRRHPKDFLKAGFATNDAAAAISINTRTLLAGNTQQRSLTLPIVNRLS